MTPPPFPFPFDSPQMGIISLNPKPQSVNPKPHILNPSPFSRPYVTSVEHAVLLCLHESMLKTKRVSFWFRVQGLGFKFQHRDSKYSSVM